MLDNPRCGRCSLKRQPFANTMLRQPRRRPKVAPSGTYNDGWSDADNAALQKLLQPLRHDPPDIDPFGCFGSEARGLACASRDLVYDRTMSFLSTLNVMSGLVLAAIAPLATGTVQGRSGNGVGRRARGRGRGRATSSPRIMAVGGFFFDFGCIRTRRGVPGGPRWDRGEGRCWSGPARSRGRARRRRRGAGVSEALVAFEGA